MALNTDVLVVGAGPIGLINAWGMKYLNPKLNIVVLEKYAEYQRSHTLVMDATQLEAIMKATHSENHPILVQLLKQLKRDPHIRTNTLQQILTQLAKSSGVEILTEQEVKAETIKEKLAKEYPNVRLIIGADGTHSVVSRSLFSDNNQVKHEYDYVLQLRFDINGEEKSPGIQTQHFYQQMARKGLIANEYVGHFENGKTPVTMQMMISKEDFIALQKATSKNPIKPFSTSAPTPPDTPKLPSHLQSFITSYLQYKVQDTSNIGQIIDNESIRISVNEAPATHAKQVVNTQGNARVVLEGDSALGLSYFKGLNAGLQASARFLATMSSSIKNSFRNTDTMDELLHKYQTWFLKDFTPRKVKEVGNYSFWRVRSFMNAMRAVRFIKRASVADYDDDLEPAIKDYFQHFTRDPFAKAVNPKWHPFPHREYPLIKFGQLSYVPLNHTAKKIGKIFIDYFKAYKSGHQIGQDFKQPLVGIGNFFTGLIKTGTGIFTLNHWSLIDGLFNMVRGVIELATTPLTWFIKPITRGLATLIHGGFKKIEENEGMRHLAQYGQAYLAHKKDDDLVLDKTIYELLAVCNDMHRKFDKSVSQGQKTDLEIEEYSRYAAIRSDNTLNRQKLVQYFSLFTFSNEEKKDAISPETVGITTSCTF
ncbi:FAD-dependent oxidoreductase [Legionella sainthelensi]|uniref:FAD-dependent oxidoreductase n=1 Tax=Legionella sainthelensi TaxID=28087 RepID=UPI000E1FDB25|nr:hypothetical protein [Legionella sainthelensi]